jgi:hypothetical protein
MLVLALAACGEAEPLPDVPAYFLAVHNEPFHRDGGEAMLATEYLVLREMVDRADRLGLKLTLMFSAQWGDYISESEERRAALARWSASGHEIAAHHHSIYHGSWDGYTGYTQSEAEAERKRLGKVPERYLGTLSDFMSHTRALNPSMSSGCLNDEHDKQELPDEIVVDTCSGFANTGEPGRRVSDATDSAKGVNDYVTVGRYRGIERRWLTHYQVTTEERAQEASRVLDRLSGASVYGAVTHSTASQAEAYYAFFEHLHALDPEARRSRTLSQVVAEGLLPERSISDDLVSEKEAPAAQPQGKCGDGSCDALEKADAKLCPSDCP